MLPFSDIDDIPSTTLLGCRVDLYSASYVSTVIVPKIMAGTAQPRCRHIVTLNPEQVMMTRADRRFRETVEAADLVVVDGVGVDKALAWLGLPPSGGLSGPESRRLTGVEITELIAAQSAVDGTPIFFLGASPGAAQATAEALMTSFPGCVVAGVWDGGSAAPEHDQESIRRITDSGAAVVLVAYGAPGQVFWIERNQEALSVAGVRLAIGIGGAFDFLSRRVPRAPEWIRRAGFEWLFRLVRQPWRLRRQLVLPVFAWDVWREKRRRAVLPVREIRWR